MPTLENKNRRIAAKITFYTPQNAIDSLNKNNSKKMKAQNFNKKL